MYINLDTLAIITLNDIKNAHPNISFPASPSDDHLKALGFSVLTDDQPPAYEWFESISLGDPIAREGAWVREWTVAPLPDGGAAKLAQTISSLITEVDQSFDEWIGGYITLSPAVMDVYRSNYDQALAYTQDGSVGAMLQIVMDNQGMDADAAADFIIAQHDILNNQLKPLGEAVRQATKSALRQATSPDDAYGVFEGLIWPSVDTTATP